MIIKVKAEPSSILNGTYTYKGSRVIHIAECEQIHVDTGDRVVVYVRVPESSTDVSCCDNCHLSYANKDRIRGLCNSIAGCGAYKLHYIDVSDMLEEI